MTTVFKLFSPSRPTNVAWFVIPAAVNAVESVLWRRLATHVGQKSRVIIPQMAKGYAGSSIAVIGMVVRIVAAAARLFPRNVFGGLPRFAVRCLALAEPLGGGFIIPAATGFGMTSDKMTRSDQPPLTAIATAEPNNISVGANMAEADDGKSIKSLTSEVFLVGHEESI